MIDEVPDFLDRPIKCCWCGEIDVCRNVVMLDKRAPQSGTGWGCLVCHLPSDGAVAVACDACGAAHLIAHDPEWVVDGYMTAGIDNRVRFDQLPSEVFSHDYSLHAAD